jgi:hypothetical protein
MSLRDAVEGPSAAITCSGPRVISGACGLDRHRAEHTVVSPASERRQVASLDPVLTAIMAMVACQRPCRVVRDVWRVLRTREPARLEAE